MANRTPPDWPSILRALEIARNTEDGPIAPEIVTILENTIRAIWRRIQSQPDSYVLTQEEYAVFNYFQDRFRGNATAQRARARYWDNPRRRSRAVNGPC